MAQKYCITGILTLQRGSALRGGVWVGAWERGPGGRNTRNGKRFVQMGAHALARPRRRGSRGGLSWKLSSSAQRELELNFRDGKGERV